jgi:lipid-A-disaccharide synthase
MGLDGVWCHLKHGSSSCCANTLGTHSWGGELNKRIFFSVGEPSGDLHTAKLINSLLARERSIDIVGFGGTHMQQAGCELLYPLTELAVVGFVEVLPKLREFFRVADLASQSFDMCKPDAVVLVDFPGFNWHIAKRAKQRGIPVFYYLPPQLWAWGQWRVHKLRRTVDHVLCNLPFEQEWFEKNNVSSEYVGHPFFDDVQNRKLDQRYLDRWSNDRVTQVGVLPGSRSREVRKIWPMQLQVIRHLAERHPGTRFHIACLKDSHCLWCKQQLNSDDQQLDIHFFVGKTSEVIQRSDCALSKSGSVSLELMARNVPTVIVYHAGRILYHVGKLLTGLNSMTLPNMLAGKKVMEEYMAVGSTKLVTQQATIAMDRLLSDPAELNRQRLELKQLSGRYAQHGASDKAAEKILAKLENHASEPSVRVAAA